MLGDSRLGTSRGRVRWGILFCFPCFGVLFKNLDSHRAPVRSTERTLHALPILLIVLEAAHQTLSMDLPTTAVPTVRQVFLMPQRITADRAHFVWLELPRWNNFSVLGRSLGPVLSRRSSTANSNACVPDCAATSSWVSVAHNISSCSGNLGFPILPAFFIT